jgi:hypothetical protein
MRRTACCAFLVGAALLSTSFARAQTIAPVVGAERPDARAWVEGAWDPTFLFGSGLSTRVRSIARTRFDIDVALLAPVLLVPHFSAWQVAAGASLTHVRSDGLGASIGVHPDLRSSSDSVASMFAFGASVFARPGYYARSWSAAVDLGWSGAIATHVAPKEPVHDLFRERYADGSGSGPSSGFYGGTSHRFRFGGAFGFGFARAAALHTAFGFAWTPQLAGAINPPYGPLPFYVTLGGAYRW